MILKEFLFCFLVGLTRLNGEKNKLNIEGKLQGLHLVTPTSRTHRKGQYNNINKSNLQARQFFFTNLCQTNTLKVLFPASAMMGAVRTEKLGTHTAQEAGTSTNPTEGKESLDELSMGSSLPQTRRKLRHGI